LALSDVPVAAEFDTPDAAPELTDAYIRFNGIGEDGHETFCLVAGMARQEGCPLPRERRARTLPIHPGRFDFCKTARKPYDVLVTAVLWIAHEEYGLRVSSDGTMEPDGLPAGSYGYVDEWAAGHALAARTNACAKGEK
jgi:hypothetical protein